MVIVETSKRFESALLVPVPAVAAAVDVFRQRLDPSADRGIPPHVTILYPFAPPESLDGHLMASLQDLFRTVPPFQFHFRTVHWFGNEVLWLGPNPDTPFRELTQLVAARWPDFPPYRGEHSDPIPHLTIGVGASIEELEQAEHQVADRLPISALAHEVWLMTGSEDSNSWKLETAFQLGVSEANRRVGRS
jgi:2'-5' RNA ligase